MDASYFATREFQELSYQDQAEIIYAHIDWIEALPRDSRPFSLLVSRLTTSILRAKCGCSFESILDELSGEWIEINTHGPECHRKRFPIDEDLADRTIERRAKRVKPMSHEMMVHLEERQHAKHQRKR